MKMFVALIILVFTGGGLLLFVRQLERTPLIAATLALISSIFASMLFAASTTSSGVLMGMIRLGPLSGFVSAAIALVGALTIIGIMARPEKYRAGICEVYAFVVYVVLGSVLLVSSNNLLLLYIGIELASYSSYVLVAYYRNQRLSIEAASKYFVLGAVASALLLYGISLVFASGGSIYYDSLALSYASGVPMLAYPALALILIGFAFKLALVPFHAWTPDAYLGAPTMVAALISVGPKVAIVTALAVLLQQVFAAPELQAIWQPTLLVLAILTMTIGNLQALNQQNLKRLLGFSSVAQLGTIAVGLVAASGQGFIAIIVYGIAYIFSNMGAFSSIAALKDAGVPATIQSYQGLGKRHPLMAGLFTVFLLSLAGLPLLAGFIGKLFVFKSAIDSSLYILAGIAIANTVLSYFYYFRVIIAMWLYEETAKTPRLNVNPIAFSGLVVCAIAVFIIGILPGAAYNMANDAVSHFNSLVILTGH